MDKSRFLFRVSTSLESRATQLSVMTQLGVKVNWKFGKTSGNH